MSREEDLLREIDELRQDRRQSDIRWREEVSGTLREVNTTLGAVCTAQQEMNKKLVAATEILTGNGTPEKGLVVRVDRVEQEHKIQSRWFWVLVPTSVTALGAAVWNYFTKP